MPSKVDKIYKAIKRDNPSIDDTQAWAMAYATYNKTVKEGISGNEESLWVLRDSIIEFFRNNQYPTDNDIHQLAMDLNVQHYELEREIYALLSDLLVQTKTLPKVESKKEINMGPFALYLNAAKK